MNNPHRFIFALGALSAATAVGLGAYAAHGLDRFLVASGFESDLIQRIEWFETGVRYQMYHSLGLLIAGLLATQARGTAICFLIGILLFSGSLYAMAVVSEDYRWLGAIVPIGGLSFIIGWVMLAWNSWQRSEQPEN